MKRGITLGLIAVLLIAGFGCSRTQKGGVIGGSAGAVVGGIIGKQAGNTAAGAILGAAIGGAAGAYIGRQMDKQAEEIARDLEGAKVERIGEGIKVTFDSGILFDVNKAELQPAAKTNLTELAQILGKYSDTDVLVEGHTDSTGSNEHNLTLSEQRAQSVRNYLVGLGVAPPRFSIMGYGEDQPVATNDTPEGRQANRRVELAIMANDKMKKEAEKQVAG
jgi:outer membrane protein OmpA-like peptidoglycan-associated protein